MVLNLHPKCANPSCAAAFDWMAGGKLFRFHHILAEPAVANEDSSKSNSQRASGHFWLCEQGTEAKSRELPRTQTRAVPSKFVSLTKSRKGGAR